jgi:hypothetical protein
MRYFPRGERIGIEIELQNIIFDNDFTSAINNLGFQTTRDASVESNGPMLFNKPVYKLNDEKLPKLCGLNQVHYGGEITSQPSDPNDARFISSLNNLTKFLQNEGYYSPRASLHVHVNVGKETLTLHELQSIFRWATRLESAFYRIGSFGQVHRGIENNYNYCRPLTKEGPLIVETPKGYGQIVKIKDLLEADTMDEFWSRYGDTINSLDKKYVAIRYHWFNMFPYWKLGTMEFRPANLTLNPYYIRAYINLCQAVAYTMLTTSYAQIKELDLQPINSLYEPNDEDAREALKFVLNNFPQGDASLKDLIMKIYDDSSFPPIRRGYVKTHLFDKQAFKYFFGSNYIPDSVPNSLVEEPIYIDDHKKEANDERIKNVPINFIK